MSDYEYYCFSCELVITLEDTAEGEQGERYCQECWIEVVRFNTYADERENEPVEDPTQEQA